MSDKNGTTGKPVNPEYPTHPAAEIFPAPTQEERDGLLKDIKAHGVKEAIYLTEDGRLLDGRTRLAICNELGIRCPTRVYKGLEPEQFSVSLNLHRRHLTTEERSRLASQLVTTKHGGSKRKAATTTKQVTVKQAAKIMRVSPMSVKRAIRKRKEEKGLVPPLPERPKARAPKVPTQTVDQAVTLTLPDPQKVMAVLVENDGLPITPRLIGKHYLRELAPLIPWVTPKEGGVFEIDSQLKKLCETWGTLDKATRKAVLQAAKASQKAPKAEKAEAPKRAPEPTPEPEPAPSGEEAADTPF